VLKDTYGTYLIPCLAEQEKEQD